MRDQPNLDHGISERTDIHRSKSSRSHSRGTNGAVNHQVAKTHIRWKAATKTLAKLHAVDYRDVGLEKFGRAEGYYIRQMKTFKTISETQAATEDIKTGRKVGPVPHFNELLEWFAKHLPKDRTSIVHGDYKLDNMVPAPFCKNSL